MPKQNKASKRTPAQPKKAQPKKALPKSQAQPKQAAKRAAQPKKAPKQRQALSAATCDRHDLYERSVQDPDAEIELIERWSKKLCGAPARSLREDFCGTALLSTRWVASHPSRTATGVDLDPKVLASGRRRHVAELGEAAARLTLLEDDVRTRRAERFDVVCAYNFSYWIFTDRRALLDYFRSVHGSLAQGGLFTLDAYGGTEAMSVQEEPRQVKGGFTYVWDQATFNPIDHRVVNHIHFRFKDGTALERAFTYAWRFWTLPELRELLEEAGFSHVEVYWDVASDEDDTSYRPRKVVDNQPAWVCYLVARR
ncbi:MAG: class I SAM-dependent methyltransferase [Polyangiaceae bacterium]|nr:class I SAM-dependent methyltransferase [Polyangiaceae bacterium]